ncbi:hypothetical protein KP509_02G070200 [Ceratopteris richardii]|nr:hypothetical protein KP509_02G070200 [Ceratopteris richardii]
MAFGPGKPSYKSTQDGGVYVEKEGSLFLEFVPSSGPRQYDWSRKQIMALSVVEVGSLVGYTMTEGIEFLHDPHLGTSEAGMVRKTLKIEPMPDKSGMFFTFEVVNKVEDLNMRLSVPITKGEFTVIRSSCNFIIPYLLGWHGFINPSAIQLASSNHADAELEWSK